MNDSFLGRSTVHRSGIDVSPNPATEGGSVTIRGEKNGEGYIYVPGQAGSTRVKLDKNGKATVKVPVKAGKEFILSTKDGMDVTVDRALDRAHQGRWWWIVLQTLGRCGPNLVSKPDDRECRDDAYSI